MATPLPPDLSAQARDVLATAPPAKIPFPVNQLTVRVMRAAFRRRRRGDLDAAVERWGVATTPGRVAGGPVTELVPRALGGGASGGGTGDDYLVYLHGGGFVVGAPVDPLVIGLVGAVGRRCAAVHYPFAPEARFPVALDRVEAAWAELTRARQGRPVLVGTSAGGNLALGLVQRLLAKGVDAHLPTGLVLFSPAADLHEPPDPTYLANEGVDPLIRWEGMIDVSLAAYVGDADRDDPEVSPALGDYRALRVPTLLVTGGTDLLHGETHRLAQTLAGQGVPVEVDDAPGLWHAYQQTSEMPETLASLERVAAFVQRCLTGSR